MNQSLKNFIPDKLPLNNDEKMAYARDLMRLERAKQNREKNTRFFDGMSYTEDFVTNENNKNTFLSPVKNPKEVLIGNPASEKKLDAIKNEMLAMEVRGGLSAFDEFDRSLSDLSADLTDIIRRTLKQERDPMLEDTNDELIDDLICQRGAYVQESFSVRSLKNGTVQLAQCQRRVVSGLKMFPGETALSPYRWNMQPFVAGPYDLISYSTAKALYGHLENFKYVDKNKTRPFDQGIYLGEQFNYRFSAIEDGEVEVVPFEDLPNNYYQLYLNGVPMFPFDNPIPWSYPGYSTQFFVNKPVSRDFLYGRPYTAGAKALQSLSDEFLRSLIRKAQQAMSPPVGIPKMGKNHISQSFWDPGSITSGISKDSFFRMIDHDGITQSDFQMFSLIERKIEEFIGTPIPSQNFQSSRDVTASEVLTTTKQFLKNLGWLIASRIRAEKILTEMRLYSILDNYLDPITKRFNKNTNKPFDVYRTFDIEDSVLENKQKGRKTIYFVDQTPSLEELQQAREIEKREEEKGNAIEFHYLDVKKLKDAPKNFEFWAFVEDREGTALDKVLFQEQFSQGLQIANAELTPAGQNLNFGMIKEIFERKWRARDWFQTPAPQKTGVEGLENPIDKKINLAMDEIDELSKEGVPNSGTLGAQTVEGLQGAAKNLQSSLNAASIV